MNESQLKKEVESNFDSAKNLNLKFGRHLPDFYDLFLE